MSAPVLDVRRDLLAAVAANLRVARRGEDGRLDVFCPFHDDQCASAVVFPNGWFFCHGCLVNEAPFQWTRRPEVRAWAAALVFRGAGGRFKFPDLALRAGWWLLPAPPADCPREGDLLMLACDPDDGDFDRLALVIRRRMGACALRLLAFGIAATQYQRRNSRLRGIIREGEFLFDVRRAAEVLGYRGHLGGDRQRKINETQQALGNVCASFTIGFSGKGEYAGKWREIEFTGPLVQRVEGIRASLPDGLSRHASVWRLHSGIMFGIRRGRWYALADPRALAVHDEDVFAVYLYLARELRRRGGRIEAPLSDVLRRAGVPAEGLEIGEGKHRQRSFKRWRRRLDKELLGRGLLASVEVDRAGNLRAVQVPDTRLPAALEAWTGRAPEVDRSGT